MQAELLLPPEILDGDLRTDPFKFGSGGVKPKPDPSLCFPPEFPYDVFSAPADAGFSEIESDEDDFLAGLTRRLTQVSLDRAYNYTSSAHRHAEVVFSVAVCFSGFEKSLLCVLSFGVFFFSSFGLGWLLGIRFTSVHAEPGT